MSANQDTRRGPSFSLLNRLARVFWNVTWFFFGRYSPAPLHFWRSMLLRLFGAKIGSHVHVYPGVKIWAPWNLEIGDETGVGNGATLYCQGKLKIGYRSVISQGVHLCGGTHDYNQPGFPLISGDIVIGNEVWVAAEAFVHPGIFIEDGAILGARSVAVKNLDEWSVYAGNPAKKIKSRERLPLS